MKKFWTMTAKAAGELQITIYEQIGQDFWSGSGLTAKSFAADLKAAGNVRRLKVLLNSPGGNVWDGLGIYDTLLAHPARVSAEVRGLCASIASVILMAAEPGQIAMTPTSSLMVHNPSTLIAGDSNEMRRMADVMDKVKSSMIESYRRHTWKSVAEIGALMDAESWYTPAEAIAAGFVDKIATPDDEDEYDDLAAAFRTPVFARFRHVPARVAQIAARFAPGDDDDEWRRRRNRERAGELREMDLRSMDASDDQRRRRRLQEIAAELAADAARPTLSDDLRRRLTMARRTEELRVMRLQELAARGGGSVEEGRRRIMAERAKELAAWAPVTFRGQSSGAGGAFPK